MGKPRATSVAEGFLDCLSLRSAVGEHVRGWTIGGMVPDYLTRIRITAPMHKSACGLSLVNDQMIKSTRQIVLEHQTLRCRRNFTSISTAVMLRNTPQSLW